MIIYISHLLLALSFCSYFVFRYLAQKSTNFDGSIQYGVGYIIAGSISIFILLGLLFYYYREKQYLYLAICLLGLGLICAPYIINMISVRNQQNEFARLVSDWNDTVENKVFTSTYRNLSFSYASKIVTGDEVFISETEDTIEVKIDDTSIGKIQIFKKNPKHTLMYHLTETYPQCQFSPLVDETKEEAIIIYNPTCPRISQYPETVTTLDTFIGFNDAPEYYLYLDIPLEKQDLVKANLDSNDNWWETIRVDKQPPSR